ncbi:MAG: hypothetical protein ACXVEF_20995 [Polyangiales bacterium]
MRLVACAIACMSVFAACRSGPARDPKAPPPKEVTSNVERKDYAGSTACAPCHADLFERWNKTPMHNMTRAVDAAHVQAPFDGSAFRFKDDVATFLSVQGRRYMRLETKEKGVSLFRVTKVIGGHHREDFAGVEVAGTEEGAHTIGERDRVLPVSYMIEQRAFRYKGYSVMEKERPGLRASGEWRRRCIFCHNTEPYLDVMLNGFLLDQDPKAFQGVVVDALIPREKQAKYAVLDADAFQMALHKEIRLLDVNDGVFVARANDTKSTIERATSSLRARFDERNLLELGIGCESCHLGAKEHVLDPRTKTSFVPRAPYLSVTYPAGDAQPINRACARCHQVLFSAYPWTWEGGLRAKNPGGSHINSGEGRDFLLGGCASKMTCTTCHDPHEPHAKPRSDNGVCTKCHAGKDDVSHTHHDSKGEGGQCVSCHMPKKNMSLDGRMTRYHRIGSPTDKSRVEGDRPLECALCHTNKSVSELVTAMSTWWKKTYDDKALIGLYGKPDGNPLLATLYLGKPHEQATAIAVLGEAKAKPAVPFLVPLATHPTPLLRYFVVDALKKILGQPSPVDLHRDDAMIAEATRSWVESTGVVLPK